MAISYFLVKACVKGVKDGLQAHKDFNSSEGRVPKYDRKGREIKPGPIYGLVTKAEEQFTKQRPQIEGKDKEVIGENADAFTNVSTDTSSLKEETCVSHDTFKRETLEHTRSPFSDDRAVASSSSEKWVGGENYGPQVYSAKREMAQAIQAAEVAPPPYEETVSPIPSSSKYPVPPQAGFGPAQTGSSTRLRRMSSNSSSSSSSSESDAEHYRGLSRADRKALRRTRKAQREVRKAERKAQRDIRRAERDVVKAERKAERKAEKRQDKLDRRAEKDERKYERDMRKALR